MIVCNFNLSSTQIQILLTFRNAPDTRASDGHGLMQVDHTVVTLRKLCREGYLEWMKGEGPGKSPPGYLLTPKGEMMLRIIEAELRRSLSWFEGESQPISTISGAQNDVATGKATINDRGKYKRTKRA